MGRDGTYKLGKETLVLVNWEESVCHRGRLWGWRDTGDIGEGVGVGTLYA